ncbi:hypothetical protein K438DRAFT_1764488 [Mycena galopus ATCC 62051]|nr:hypothetical protein K438DRAFT_1764488 [Mycena galopus ATCC 62051]
MRPIPDSIPELHLWVSNWLKSSAKSGAKTWVTVIQVVIRFLFDSAFSSEEDKYRLRERDLDPVPRRAATISILEIRRKDQSKDPPRNITGENRHFAGTQIATEQLHPRKHVVEVQLANIFSRGTHKGHKSITYSPIPKGYPENIYNNLCKSRP